MPFPSDDLEKCARAIQAELDRQRIALDEFCDGIELMDVAQAALTALTECGYGKVPDGWKLVPIEPTAEMLHAGVRAFQQAYNSADTLSDWRACFRAALESSPTPPQQKEPG